MMKVHKQLSIVMHVSSESIHIASSVAESVQQDNGSSPVRQIE